MWAAIPWITRSRQKWQFNWKKVSEWTAKLSRHNVFSTFLLPPHSVLIYASGRQWQQGKHRYVGCDIIDRTRSPQKWQFNWKKVSERTAKLSRCNVFSPFFLPPCSVLIKERGRQWRRGEHRSVGCDIIDRAHSPQKWQFNWKKVSERTVNLSKCNGFSPFFW
jgi:hypothetical protein